MKKARLEKMEAKMGPQAYTCILFDRSDERPNAIRCPHAGQLIDLEDCQGFGGKCPHNQNFVHVYWDFE